MRLLLAVDLNDHPDQLVEQGAAWALKLGATLDLLFVDAHASASDPDPAVQTLLEHLHVLQKRIPPTVCGEFLLRQGSTAEEIGNISKDYDAVLISTHGRQGLAHTMLGSVAEQVVRTATVPVLVLPQAQLDT